MNLKKSSAKWRTFWLDLSVLVPGQNLTNAAIGYISPKTFDKVNNNTVDPVKYLAVSDEAFVVCAHIIVHFL